MCEKYASWKYLKKTIFYFTNHFFLAVSVHLKIDTDLLRSTHTLRKYVCVTIFLHLQSRCLGRIATRMLCIFELLLFTQKYGYILPKVYLAKIKCSKGAYTKLQRYQIWQKIVAKICPVITPSHISGRWVHIKYFVMCASNYY